MLAARGGPLEARQRFFRPCFLGVLPSPIFLANALHCAAKQGAVTGFHFLAPVDLASVPVLWAFRSSSRSLFQPQ
jgi:hypothetical protein